MRDKSEFQKIIEDIHGQEFERYGLLAGDFDFTRFVVKIVEAQKAPDSPATLLLLRVPQLLAGFPSALYDKTIKRVAMEDFLARRVARFLDGLARFDSEGLARRRLRMAAPGAAILPRSCIAVTEDFIEVRLSYALPAVKGKIDGVPLREVFFNDLPALVNTALNYYNLDGQAMAQAIAMMEDADVLRRELPSRGWIGFIAEGSRIGRSAHGKKQPLRIAADDQVEVDLPHAGKQRGLAITSGITVLLGENGAGRVDLIKALATGVYNHRVNDGREYVVSAPDTVHVNADRGRAVQRVPKSLFVESVPEGPGSRAWTTTAADGYISQAAGTVEALEAGSRVLLFDESESDISFLTHDARLASLLPAGANRPESLAQCCRRMADSLGMSIVIGGVAAVAEFLPLADRVLAVEDFTVRDITAAAREQAAGSGMAAETPATRDLSEVLRRSRVVVPHSVDAALGCVEPVISAGDKHHLTFGNETLCLAHVDALVDEHQTLTLGLILQYAKRYLDGQCSISELLDRIDQDISAHGLDGLSPSIRGDLARPRRYEIAAALNRLASLRISSLAEV